MDKDDSRTFHHCWSMLWEEMLVRFILPCCTGLAICLGQWVPDLSLIVNLILVLIKFYSKPVTRTVAIVFNIWSCIILRNMERTMPLEHFLVDSLPSVVSFSMNSQSYVRKCWEVVRLGYLQMEVTAIFVWNSWNVSRIDCQNCKADYSKWFDVKLGWDTSLQFWW